MRWDPAQYARYADERARPFVDLTARVGAIAPRRVVDVGCGTGVLTELLADRWPQARVEGFDSSPEMIAEARSRGSARVTYDVADAANWTMSDDVDVLVANAVLQWVPGHLEPLHRWAELLPAGGWIAVQVPGNFDAPSHRLMRELATSARWAPRLSDVLHHDAVQDPGVYARLLLDAGLMADVWETTYVHVLTGEDPVLAWMRGTGLRPVLAALDDDAREFEDAYARQLRAAYPVTAHGTLFPFRRIFAVASRP